MKRSWLSLGLMFALTCAGVGSVHALEATTSGSREERTLIKNEKLDVIKAARAEAQEERTQKRETARERWEAVKDERKLRLLEKLELNLQLINEKATDHFARILDRLNQILAKIVARAEAQSKVLPEIALAQTAIDTSEAAVAAQAAKIYDLNVTSEATAAGQVRLSMQQLKADLAVVRQTVSAARQAVLAALQALKGEPDAL